MLNLDIVMEEWLFPRHPFGVLMRSQVLGEGIGTLPDHRRLRVLDMDDHLTRGRLGADRTPSSVGDDVLAPGHLTFQLLGPGRVGVDVAEPVHVGLGLGEHDVDRGGAGGKGLGHVCRADDERGGELGAADRRAGVVQALPGLLVRAPGHAHPTSQAEARVAVDGTPATKGIGTGLARSRLHFSIGNARQGWTFDPLAGAVGAGPLGGDRALLPHHASRSEAPATLGLALGAHGVVALDLFTVTPHSPVPGSGRGRAGLQLFHQLARLLVGPELEARRTAALKAWLEVGTVVRAAAVIHGALVNIDTLALVAQLEPWMTGAVEGAGKVDAVVIAAAIVEDALVLVQALLPVEGVDGVARLTSTLIRANLERDQTEQIISSKLNDDISPDSDTAGDIHARHCHTRHDPGTVSRLGH